MTVRIYPKDKIPFRKAILESLARANRTAKTEEERWVDIKELEKVSSDYCTKIISYCIRLGLVETRAQTDKFRVVTKSARITHDGLWALENNLLTYSAMQTEISVPGPIFQELRFAAENLGITRGAGRGAGKTPSVTALLRGVSNRRVEFEKWFRAVYADVYEAEAETK